jgi:hypothetical protein
VYRLVHDAASIESAVTAAAPTEAARLLSRLILQADVALVLQARRSALWGGFACRRENGR